MVMSRIFVLVAILASLSIVNSLTGSHVCYRSVAWSQRYYTSCGFAGWKRCGRYRTLYKSQAYCCTGWKEDNHGGCTTPICSRSCQNGGTCIGPNRCGCDVYHSGQYCQTELAVCIPPCGSGGHCIGPNTCQCDIYHYGHTCQFKKSCSSKAMELFFLLDSPGSIGQANFEKVKSFAKAVIEQFDIASNKTRVGLITFSRYPMIRFALSEHKNIRELLQAVDNVPYIPGITETHSALRLLLQEGFIGSRASSVPHVVVLITEGKSLHQNDTRAAAEAIHQNGIIMFVIGVGDRVSKEELGVIATNPDDRHLFLVDNYTMVSSLKENVTTLTCDTAHLSYTSFTPPKPVVIQHARRDPIDDCIGKLADIVFVLDSSKSLGASTWLGATGFRSVDYFALNIVNDLDIAFNSTMVGVISFSTYPAQRVLLGSTDDKLEILNALNQIVYYSGLRDTDKALQMLRLEGFENGRDWAPNFAILITDGPSSNSFLSTRAANELKQSGVEVFAVGVGDHFDRVELEQIASSGSTHVFTAPNFLEFEMASFEGLVSKTICQALPYTTTTTTTTPTTPTSTTAPTTTVRLTQTVTQSAGCLPDAKEVVFLVDSSGSVGDVNFVHIKGFIKQTIETFDIGLTKTRVGLILFNANAKVEFPLDRYDTKQDLLNAVDNIVYTPGGTNTGAALELLRTQAFTNNRTDAPNIAFLITDGYSTDKNSTKQQAMLAKENNHIQIVAIGIGELLDLQELVDIASSNPSRNRSLIYHVDDFDELHVFSLEKILASVVCDVETTTLALTTTQTPTTELCADEVDNCDEYEQEMCTSYRPWAMAHCKRFCGFCQGAPTSPTPCVDTIDNCREYGHEICNSASFRLWTKQHCARFCELCVETKSTISTSLATTTQSLPTTKLCKDAVDNCDEYEPDMCTKYRPWAMAHCSRFCGYCQGGPTTPTPCVDTIDNCREYGHDICTSASFRLWIKQHCARFCELCVETTSTTLPTTSQSPPTTEMCKDEVDNCDEYVQEMCTSYHPWAVAHCKRYCGFCQGAPTSPTPCVDTIDNCREYGHDICTLASFRLWTKQHCARFCELCGPSTSQEPCVDEIDNCKEFGNDICTTPTLSIWVKQYCASFCSVCDAYKMDVSGTSAKTTDSNVVQPSSLRQTTTASSINPPSPPKLTLSTSSAIYHSPPKRTTTAPSVTQPSPPKRTTTAPSVTQPSSPKAATSASSVNQPSPPKRTTTAPSVTQPSPPKRTTTAPGFTQPSLPKRTTTAPSVTQPSPQKRTTTTPSVTQPSPPKPTTSASSVNQPSPPKAATSTASVIYHSPPKRTSTALSVNQPSPSKSTTSVSSILHPSPSKPSTSASSVIETSPTRDINNGNVSGTSSKTTVFSDFQPSGNQTNTSLSFIQPSHAEDVDISNVTESRP